jgi:putative transposase
LERRYGEHYLHFITCSCYRRAPLLGSPDARDIFLEALNQTRSKYGFLLVGYVVMPEHVHLLLGEPRTSTPSTVMQVVKQKVSRTIGTDDTSFWQRRFYDFNVWSRKKIFEKLHYMHMNPVKRGLVDDPGLWDWSSIAITSSGRLDSARRTANRPDAAMARKVKIRALHTNREECGTRKTKCGAGTACCAPTAWAMGHASYYSPLTLLAATYHSLLTKRGGILARRIRASEVRG